MIRKLPLQYFGTLRLFLVAAFGCSVIGAGYLVTRDADHLLQAAARDGFEFVISPLLWIGADLHAGNGEALRLAASWNRKRIAERLLDAGADIHAGDDQPLRLAAAQGHTDMVALLLARGANVKAQKDGALRWAAAAGHANTEALLREYYQRKGYKPAHVPPG